MGTHSGPGCTSFLHITDAEVPEFRQTRGAVGLVLAYKVCLLQSVERGETRSSKKVHPSGAYDAGPGSGLAPAWFTTDGTGLASHLPPTVETIARGTSLTCPYLRTWVRYLTPERRSVWSTRLSDVLAGRTHSLDMMNGPSRSNTVEHCGRCSSPRHVVPRRVASCHACCVMIVRETRQQPSARCERACLPALVSVQVGTFPLSCGTVNFEVSGTYGLGDLLKLPRYLPRYLVHCSNWNALAKVASPRRASQAHRAKRLVVG